jgi:hypothetical protein
LWTRSKLTSTRESETGGLSLLEGKKEDRPHATLSFPRCIQVHQTASADDPTAWAEFSSKVKEGIITTFDTNVGLYEEDVRKADSQRQLEGWQYLPFFSQKASLAGGLEREVELTNGAALDRKLSPTRSKR